MEVQGAAPGRFRARCSREREFFYETLEDLVQSPAYNDFRWMDISGNKLDALPPVLPPALEILVFNHNRITAIPPLPRTLRALYGRVNKITHLPDTSGCPALETIDLYDNHIGAVDVPMVPELRALDLSFNKVRSMDWSALPASLVSLKLSYNFLTEPPPTDHLRGITTYDHNDIPDRFTRWVVRPQGHDTGPGYEYTWRTNTRVPAIATPVVYKDSQNVHAHSVQTSVNESLNYVLNYKPKPRPVATMQRPIGHLDGIEKLFAAKQWWKRIFSASSRMPGRVREWCLDPTLHSVHGVTFNRLLSQVWAIIQDHEHREALEGVLKEDLEASAGVCFTGRFSRVLNTLTGFVDQVQVGISKSEQLQNQVAAAVRKGGPAAELRKTVEAILKDHQVPEAEWSAWLDALPDD